MSFIKIVLCRYMKFKIEMETVLLLRHLTFLAYNDRSGFGKENGNWWMVTCVSVSQLQNCARGREWGGREGVIRTHLTSLEKIEAWCRKKYSNLTCPKTLERRQSKTSISLVSQLHGILSNVFSFLLSNIYVIYLPWSCTLNHCELFSRLCKSDKKIPLLMSPSLFEAQRQWPEKNFVQSSGTLLF